MNRKTIIQKIRRNPILIDVHTHVGTDPASYQRGDFPYAQSAEDLIVRMDRWGVDTAVCFPFLYTTYYDKRAYLNGRIRKSRSDCSPAPYVNENRRICEEIYEAYPLCAGRLLPFGFFDASRNQTEQVKALHELADQYPLFGLKTASSYTQSPITDLLGKGERLVDFASEHDIPFMLHTAVVPDDPWANVFDILKVVKARPDVRFCLAHTCRFDRNALEQANELPNCFVDLSAFTIHCDLVQQNSPAVAAKPQRFPAPYTQPAKVMQKLADAFTQTMLWGTDTPAYCWMSRFTNAAGETKIMQLKCDTDAEINTFKKLPEKTRQRIGYDNTISYLFDNNHKGK
ncbi:amidohydrolase family protein [PVC group bacterium]|nr:amidohydrolase family protein [PVC group bacterium]